MQLCDTEPFTVTKLSCQRVKIIMSKWNYLILRPLGWVRLEYHHVPLFQVALKATWAAARLQNINCTVHITRRLGRWERVPPPGGSLSRQCSLVGPVRMSESFTGPIKTLRSCPAAFGPLSTCVAPPLSLRSAPGEALPDSRWGQSSSRVMARGRGLLLYRSGLSPVQWGNTTNSRESAEKRKEGIVSLDAATPGRGIPQDSRPSEAIPGSRDPVWQRILPNVVTQFCYWCIMLSMWYIRMHEPIRMSIE